ncbi:CDP-alcohol phosphatidyltransferase family protein, partial [Chloroflexota bacterium]
MLPEFRRALANPIVQSPAKLLAKSGLNPNVLTILGFLLALVVALILATGHLFLGGFLVLVSGAADLLDGSVARISGKTTRFGGLLDSVL